MQGIRLRLGRQKRAIAGAACPESIAFLATLPNDAALDFWAFPEGCSLSSLTRSTKHSIPLETDPLASALEFLRSGLSLAAARRVPCYRLVQAFDPSVWYTRFTYWGLHFPRSPFSFVLAQTLTLFPVWLALTLAAVSEEWGLVGRSQSLKLR
jgi:hypothetical protein